MKLEWVLGLCALLSIPLSIFVLLRRGIPWIWRIAAASVTVFYILWFRDDMTAVAALRQAPLRDTLPLLGQTALRLVGLVLVVLWPIVLGAGAFQRARDQAARKVQRLVVFTALFWMALVVDVFTPPFAHNWIAAVEQAAAGFFRAAASPPTQ